MNNEHRKMSENLFTSACLQLTEAGSFSPMYFMIMNNELIPIIVSAEVDVSFTQYNDIAEQTIKHSQPDAVVLIAEQWLISRKKNDPELKNIMEGKIKPSDFDDKESYLTLMYVDSDNNKQSLIGKINSDLIGTHYVKDQTWIDSCLTTMIKPWK
jgi:hypothetical protein